MCLLIIEVKGKYVHAPPIRSSSTPPKILSVRDRHGHKKRDRITKNLQILPFRVKTIGTGKKKRSISKPIARNVNYNR